MSARRAKEPKAEPEREWPPRFLVCRCGEAFERGEPHMCRPKEQRRQHVPMLYARWLNRKSKRETTTELYQHGRDPAFIPTAGQYRITTGET